MRFLFLEPFFGGSHKSFARGWQSHSRHDIDLMTLPDRFWKWRMRGAALDLFGRISKFSAYDGLIVSDMLNLADFAALAGAGLPPCLVYFHENQLTYPRSSGKALDDGLAMINVTTALAANRVIFNSRFQRAAFLEAVSGFLSRMPDADTGWCRDALLKKSGVIYPGCEFSPGPADMEGPGESPPLIIWNHRWEYDKNPGPFFKALYILQKRRVPFRLALLGQPGPEVPPVFSMARKRFCRELVHYGHLASRTAYLALLAKGDIVVSTAIQENFGISVVEAVRHGCLPLLPNRLAYPEIIPERFHDEMIYDDLRRLPDRLEAMIRTMSSREIQKRDLSAHMEPHAWPLRVLEFDRKLDRLVR